MGLDSRERFVEDGASRRHCRRKASRAISGETLGLDRWWMGMGGATSGEKSRGLAVVAWEVGSPELRGAGGGDDEGEWMSTWCISSWVDGEGGGDCLVGVCWDKRAAEGVVVTVGLQAIDCSRSARSCGLDEVMASITVLVLGGSLAGVEGVGMGGEGSGEADFFRVSWALE